VPVVFSGGVLQNKTLHELRIKTYIGQGRVFYFNIAVPTNDEGISIGQLYYQYQ
ncbi:hypothetical protein ACN5PC_11085, partial [Aliarcobacter butzleri]|uniref:Kae1-like domain-containing protein n=1 Tax=Aliarcobacter butzleri TaxID=28197 RepID=UPI003AF8A318